MDIKHLKALNIDFDAPIIYTIFLFGLSLISRSTKLRDPIIFYLKHIHSFAQYFRDGFFVSFLCLFHSLLLTLSIDYIFLMNRFIQWQLDLFEYMEIFSKWMRLVCNRNFRHSMKTLLKYRNVRNCVGVPMDSVSYFASLS